MTFFCPECWKEIKGDEKICPYCGTDITEHEKKDFEEKLINALNHPERETVQRAVWILGRLKSVRSVKRLLYLFYRTDDPFLKTAILDALEEIDTEDARVFIRSSIDSESSVVRKKAKESMDKKRNK